MIERLVPTFRMWTSVAMMWIEAVINVAVEVVRTAEPRPGTDEHTAAEPLRSVVPVWSAVVRGVIVVTVCTQRLGSDVDQDLSGCRARNASQSGEQDSKGKNSRIRHAFLFIPKKSKPPPSIARKRETAENT
jgi:hypothetical protein